MIELYILTSLTYAYIIMTDLENLRHTPTKSNLKLRDKVHEKIKELESDLKMFPLWPYLLIKKIKNEYQSRK